MTAKINQCNCISCPGKADDFYKWLANFRQEIIEIQEIQTQTLIMKLAEERRIVDKLRQKAQNV